MPGIRLDKFISERSEHTRSQIKEIARKGGISVNGVIVKAADTKIDSEKDRVTVNGREISANRYRYILLNKPAGYVSSTSDGDGKNVMELVPPELRTKGMFPAGRLDKDSLGALLITDDGELSHRILSPKKHIPKIYLVKLDRPFEDGYIEKFESGIELENGEKCLPAKVKRAESSEFMAFVELNEGKYHQVKRMFATVGNHVQQLMRVSLGGLLMPENLVLGECIELLHIDVDNLFKSNNFLIFCEKSEKCFRHLL